MPSKVRLHGNPVVSKRRVKVRDRLFLQVLPLIVLLVAWQVTGNRVGKVMMPTVTSMLSSFYHLLLDGTLLGAFGVSIQALVLGFFLSALLGVAVGLLMGLLPQVDRALSVYVSLLIATPISAAVPLVVVVFGLGLAAKVVVVVLFSVGLVIVNTATGVRNVDPRLVEMATSFGATSRQLIRHIILPGAVPMIIAGLRLALGLAVTGMVISELFVVSDGVGLLVLTYSASFETGKLYAVTAATVLLGVVALYLFSLLERKFSHWRPDPISD